LKPDVIPRTIAKFITDQVLQLLETRKLGRGEILNLTYIFSYEYNLMHVKAMASLRVSYFKQLLINKTERVSIE